MSERINQAPADVQQARKDKRGLAIFCFVVAGIVAMAGVVRGFTAPNYIMTTLFIGAGCLLLDVPIIGVIRAVRGKNGNGGSE